MILYILFVAIVFIGIVYLFEQPELLLKVLSHLFFYSLILISFLTPLWPFVLIFIYLRYKLKRYIQHR